MVAVSEGDAPPDTFSKFVLVSVGVPIPANVGDGVFSCWTSISSVGCQDVRL
jgi:hypothetical protein